MRLTALLCSVLFAVTALAWAASPDETMPDESQQSLDVEAGYISWKSLAPVRGYFDRVIELSIDKAYPDARWVATGLACVTAASSGHMVCLRVSAENASSTTLHANKQFSVDDKLVLSQEPVAGTYKLGEKIPVLLSTGPDVVRFKIGDGAWIIQALPFTPETVRLGCSTGLCNFRISNAVTP